MKTMLLFIDEASSSNLVENLVTYEYGKINPILEWKVMVKILRRMQNLKFNPIQF
jgi:hypothetical protein